LYVNPSTSFEATALFDTGLTGTLGVRIIDNAGNTTLARTTTGIAEYPASSGIYAVTLTSPATVGQYSLVWDDGTNFATDELVVTGIASTIVVGDATGYITSDQLKATLSLTGLDFADADIATAIASASRWIDQKCNRRFYPDSVATNVRYYTAARSDLLHTDDIVTLTTVEVDFNGDGTFEETWTENTDFVAEPYNRTDPYWPITTLRIHPFSGSLFPLGFPRSVKITAKFGWASTPDQVVEACTIKAAQLLRRAREAPFGIVSVGVEGQSLRIGGTDADLEALLAPYMRLTV